MALVYPKQTDEYDVDVFNNNFKELKANIDTNNINTANNLALKASTEYVDDLKDIVAGETDSLSERITAETLARVNGDKNKADSVHTHSADDIDTGILSVARGGTGNTSVDTIPTSGSTKMVTSGGVYTACRKNKSVIVVGKDYSTLKEALSAARSLYSIYGIIPDIYCIGVTETISESVAAYFGHLYLWGSTITISQNVLFCLYIGGKIEGGVFIHNGTFRTAKESFFEDCTIETK